MSHCRLKERLNILVVTSGDTGSAAGEAYKGVDGIDIHPHPADEVSLMQKKQLDTIGATCGPCADGKFDDCQNLVKEAFADKDLARFNLSSANSINFGHSAADRLLCLCLRLAGAGEEVGLRPFRQFRKTPLGCEYARRMGLLVAKLDHAHQ